MNAYDYLTNKYFDASKINSFINQDDHKYPVDTIRIGPQEENIFTDKSKRRNHRHMIEAIERERKINMENII